jgi:hypothetical protein
MYEIKKELCDDKVHYKFTLSETRSISALSAIDASVDSNKIVNEDMVINGMIKMFIKETRHIKNLDKLHHLRQRLLSVITDSKVTNEINQVFNEVFDLNESHCKDYTII